MWDSHRVMEDTGYCLMEGNKDRQQKQDQLPFLKVCMSVIDMWLCPSFQYHNILGMLCFWGPMRWPGVGTTPFNTELREFKLNTSFSSYSIKMEGEDGDHLKASSYVPCLSFPKYHC